MYIKDLGELKIDKILFASSYPILFTCINDENDLFICCCCKNDISGRKWLVTKSTPSIIIDLLSDKITIREAFLQFKDVQYSVNKLNNKIDVFKNNEDWNDNSIFLPDNECMEVEDGEFDEEIEYYKNVDK